MILGPANDETGEGAVVDQHIISENEESTPIPIGSTILSVHQPSSSNSPTLLKSLAFDKIGRLDELAPKLLEDYY